MIKLSAPISVVWEITNNCNYKCPHCRAYQMYHKEDKNIEDAIIKQLIDSKVMYVNISGGEPLLNPRIFDIAKRLANENIYLALSTNGYFYLKYRKNIVDSGIKFVQVSLDGKKELHEKFRGVKGSYEKAIEALKMAKADGLRTQMNVTITSSNINNLEWNYNIAKEIHVDKVFYRRVVPYGKAKTNKYVLPEKKLYYEQIRKLSKLDSKDLQVSIDDPILNVLNNIQSTEYIACGAGINNLGISSEGDVYPCIFLREKIGNLKTDKLVDIWNNSITLKNLRERKIEKCGECKYKYSCGGCRAFSGIYKKDDFCPLGFREVIENVNLS